MSGACITFNNSLESSSTFLSVYSLKNSLISNTNLLLSSKLFALPKLLSTFNCCFDKSVTNGCILFNKSCKF